MQHRSNSDPSITITPRGCALLGGMVCVAALAIGHVEGRESSWPLMTLALVLIALGFNVKATSLMRLAIVWVMRQLPHGSAPPSTVNKARAKRVSRKKLPAAPQPMRSSEDDDKERATAA